MIQTELNFTLPVGYLDEDGTLHREGVMRRATAADEIQPLKDPRVVMNPVYRMIILLSRVVTCLGSLSRITPKVIENLYAADLVFLQNLFNQINQREEDRRMVVCPKCQHEFQLTKSEK
jgi:hypothetical protein